MDLTDLATFETVARVGAIGRAAKLLNTVQSNVTARVRLLERELGTPLFNRHSRGVTLTSAGRQLLPFAVEAGRLVAEARRAVEDGPEPKGSLRIGSLETTAALRLPPILTRYCSAYPKVDLSVYTGTSASLVADVLEHRLDAAFVAGPVNHPDLVEDRIVTEELVLATPPALTDPAKIDAATKGIVFRIGCTYRRCLERLMEERGIRGMRLLEFGTLDGILGCVGAGLGISLLPKAVVEPLAQAGRVRMHALPPDQAKVDTVLVRRADAYVASAMVRFINCAKDG
jgi:LysR family transcriptional regulator, cell division regulator